MKLKLPRLTFNPQSQPELFKRYWDTAMTTIEALSKPCLVSELPSTPSVYRRVVSDANSVTFNAVAVGGGSNTVPVFWNGTNWRIG